jgi:hypothetical protein
VGVRCPWLLSSRTRTTGAGGRAVGTGVLVVVLNLRRVGFVVLAVAAVGRKFV